MDNTTATENATIESLTYTKEVRAAILKSTRVMLRFKRTTTWGEGVVTIECIKETEDAAGKRHDITLASFECRAFVGNGYRDQTEEHGGAGGSISSFSTWREYSRDEANIYRPESGNWGLSYINQPTHERAIFKMLPLGSKLTFHVRLDYLTSPIMAVQGLHGDLLELDAVKGKDGLHIQLDTATTRHNSARFGNPLC